MVQKLRVTKKGYQKANKSSEETPTLNKEKLNAYDALDFLATICEKTVIDDNFWENEDVKASTKIIGEALSITPNQAVALAVIGGFSLADQTASLTDIGRKTQIRPYLLYKMEDEIIDLTNRGFLKKKRVHGAIEYCIHKRILKSLKEGEIPTVTPPLKPQTDIAFIKHVAHEIICGDKTSPDEYLSNIGDLFTEHNHLSYVQRINATQMSTLDRCILTLMIDASINKKIYSIENIENIFNNEDELFDSSSIIEAICNPKSPLNLLKHIRMIEGSFGSNCYTITQKAVNDLLPHEKKKILPTKDKEEMGNVTVITPKAIHTKELIYDSSTKTQIDRLYQILSKEGYTKVRRNLSSKGLRTSINILLHGHPGMGKTETVLQLAKKTKREIMQVNIADMKSMYFGESEKLVTELFNSYNLLVASSKQTPILLFNEADAVLSKRKGIGTSNVAQTENSIQNILLQEFERSEGIIICTTNMILNLDNAFERRFLYKLEFKEPSIAVRASIMHLKLKEYLTEEECHRLSATYFISGGNADNILTKVVMQECLTGIKADYAAIEQLCKEESMGKCISRTKIGF